MSPTKMCSCFPYREPKMSFSLFSTLVSRLLCTSMEGWLVRSSWWAVTGREQRLIMTLTTCNTDETVTLFIFIHTSVPCSMCVCTVHCVCVHTVFICVCVYSVCVHVCVCTLTYTIHACNTSSLSNCSFVSFQFWMFLSPPTGTTSLLMSSICVPYSVHSGQLNLLPPLVVILSDHGTHLGCKAILYSTGSGRGSPKVQQAWNLLSTELVASHRCQSFLH